MFFESLLPQGRGLTKNDSQTPWIYPEGAAPRLEWGNWGPLVEPELVEKLVSESQVAGIRPAELYGAPAGSPPPAGMS